MAGGLPQQPHRPAGILEHTVRQDAQINGQGKAQTEGESQPAVVLTKTKTEEPEEG